MQPSDYFPQSFDVRKISPRLNPFASGGVPVEIYAAACGPNIKLYPALRMLVQAKREGKLEGVHTLVENSSGNMALALGLLAPRFGIRQVVAIVPTDSPSGKLDPLRLTRIRFEFSTESGESGIELARRMGTQPGWLNLAQYENEANPEAYEAWVGPALRERLPRLPTIVCAGLGTGGTVTGLGRFFKNQSPKTVIVAVRVAPGAAVPGVRSEKRLAEVKTPWQSVSDAVIDIGTKDSFKLSRALWWDIGSHVGPSSGFALAGLLRFLENAREKGVLGRHANGDGVVRAVFICPDPANPYWDKYSTHLDPEELD